MDLRGVLNLMRADEPGDCKEKNVQLSHRGAGFIAQPGFTKSLMVGWRLCQRDLSSCSLGSCKVLSF